MERFWRKVSKSAGCWVWTGARVSGYGVFRLDGKSRKAHRVSWEMTNGPIPDGLQIRHLKCRNPACVRPSHMALGTAKDNADDRTRDGTTAAGRRHGSVTKPERVPRGDRNGLRLHPEAAWRGGPKQPARGDANGARIWPERLARGEKQGLAKLTETSVVEMRRMRSSGLSFSAIARAFGVSYANAWFVCNRKTWAHVK